MESIIYPAIFHKQENGFWVEFPDIPGCFTEGETLNKAFNMAGDALFTWFDNEELERPAPSNLNDIVAENDDVVMLVKAVPYESEEAKQFKIIEIIESGLEKKGYTKYQVAQILNVDRAYITRIANGERIPSVDLAKRIGLLLGFDWQIFYESNLS